MARSLDPSLTARLVAALRARLPDLQAVYVHGSYAQGHARPGSDLDVAVLLPPGVTVAPESWLDALTAATVATGLEADLADLRRASSELHAEVLRHGERVWDDRSSAAQTFEMHALTEYGRLRERRAALEALLLTTGRVYG